jgi:hypothetical protein
MDECVSFLQPLWKALSDLGFLVSGISVSIAGIIATLIPEQTKVDIQKRFQLLWGKIQVRWNSLKIPKFDPPISQREIVELALSIMMSAFTLSYLTIQSVSCIFCPLINGGEYNSRYVLYVIFIVTWMVFWCSFYVRQMIATLRHGNVRPVQLG